MILTGVVNSTELDTGSHGKLIIKEYWPIVLAGLSGSVYLFGYIKSLNFLHTLGISALPTEIYPPSSIFVDGLTTFVCGAPLPMLALAFGYVLSTSSTAHRAILAIVILFVVYHVCLALASLLGLEISPSPVMIIGWENNSLVSIIIQNIGVFLLIGISLASRKTHYPAKASNRLRPLLLVVLVSAWYILFLATDLFISSTVLSGKPPAEYSKEPGIMGYLIFEHYDTVASDQLGHEHTRVDTTYGILLSRHNGAYYFQTTSFSCDKASRLHSTLYIIPESRVIFFRADNYSN
jgi:hypothetical protein